MLLPVQYRKSKRPINFIKQLTSPLFIAFQQYFGDHIVSAERCERLRTALRDVNGRQSFVRQANIVPFVSFVNMSIAIATSMSEWLPKLGEDRFSLIDFR
ncbi:hypothetical protein COLO4_01785 [Corchorus olitorius]|uniref:Uncharacterized protein n=1 Tax=Corchorus olitorius TaxID=93759 RepID=A0A1R3L1Z9_9ROSI|nr:hypothetical protein COLO4_01785 [Corchorus olitorius]